MEKRYNYAKPYLTKEELEILLKCVKQAKFEKKFDRIMQKRVLTKLRKQQKRYETKRSD